VIGAPQAMGPASPLVPVLLEEPELCWGPAELLLPVAPGLPLELLPELDTA
jgi:hypothetical protein